MLKSIQRRKNYTFEWRNILYMLFWMPFWYWKWRRNSKFHENYKTFKVGEQKIIRELNIKSIIKSIRRSNALVDILLDKKQLLLKYLHSNVVYPDVKINPNKAIVKSNISSQFEVNTGHDLNDFII